MNRTHLLDTKEKLKREFVKKSNSSVSEVF